MAVAEITYLDGTVHLDLHPSERRLRIAADPEGVGSQPGIWFYWDGDKLAHGEREFLGLEVYDTSLLTDGRLAMLASLKLPRMDVAEFDLHDASLEDIARRIRETFPSRKSTMRT